jgi:pyruvate kinase
MRNAKIVCTIGPASDSPAMLERLIESGMDVARLNFSHGTYESHAASIAAIRRAAGRHGRAVAIIQDLQGPRIRIGALGPEGIDVRAGQMVHLRASPTPEERADPRCVGAVEAEVLGIPVTYPGLIHDIRPGARVLIDDGLIELLADRVIGASVECRVLTGGRISSHKGVNLPGTVVSAPSLSEKDRDDLRFGIEHGVDYVALSFVKGPDDIVAARRVIADCGGDLPVIAKIERAEAVAALDMIMDQADGVMIARGDLGVEMGPEAVPLLQKRIIVEANRRRCVVITATQMLESMTRALRPTRAEASDVANAVFDGTDAVMLSAETSIGAHPIEAVQVMDRIVKAAESAASPGSLPIGQRDGEHPRLPDALCAAAFSAAQAVGARAVVAFTERGATARLISKQRPGAMIVALTPHESVRRQMALYWGVTPYAMPQVEHTDARVDEAERRLKSERLIKAGDTIVIMSGTHVGHPGGTNWMKLHTVR